MSNLRGPTRPILLCSLGTSWAVVPEAFHRLSCLDGELPGFAQVHVLTSEEVEIVSECIPKIRSYFDHRFPKVPLTFTCVAGFSTLRSEADQFAFEEVLYRWMIDVAPNPGSRWVCLAGGFKTMSAAMQKAATLLGAADIFHVLADPGINTDILVDQALQKGSVRFVNLGPESGWPQFRRITASNYPLEIVKQDGVIRWVRPGNRADHCFLGHVQEVTERMHGIARSWNELTDLPFTDLAMWPEADLNWLRQPLDPTSDVAWVRSIPKVELHCHLGGFATHGVDLEAVRAKARHPERLPPVLARELPRGWPRPPQACGLKAYLPLGDNNGSKLLRDPGCLEWQCRLLYQRLVEDGVRYAEIRCSPNNYAEPGGSRSSWDVLREIQATFQDCMEEASKRTSGTDGACGGCHVNLIIIATRKEADKDRSHISRHLALAITAADQWRGDEQCRVVGVDLAGFESERTRAELFQIDFEPVHRVGLAVTVHAGENDDAEGIWQAVYKLHARRLGHALHLSQAEDLERVVADRRIGVEMCPYANMQIKGFSPVNGTDASDYPLLRYLRGGICVTANTDNLGISAATLSDNLLLLADLCPGITRIELLRLQRNALECAFLSNEDRMSRVAQLGRALPRP